MTDWPRPPSRSEASVGGAAILTPPPPASPSPFASIRTIGPLAVVVFAGAVTAACVVGTAAWYFQARAHPARAAPPVAPAQRVGVGRSTGEGDSVPLSATAHEAPSSRVTFHVTPKHAVLVVDGVVLPAGIDTVQRAADGRPMKVLLRADRYEDHVEIIGPSTPDLVAVTLGVASARAPSRPRAPVQTASAAAPASSVLPNPYE